MLRHTILLTASLVYFSGPVAAYTTAPEFSSTLSAPFAVQASANKAFRRCMRERYGPRYFRGVKRAHRYFMAQACGG